MENKKRPRGLKKATAEAKNKRAKVDEDPDHVDLPEISDEATIAIEGAEDGDEVFELKSMYEIAYAKQAKGDSDEALMLYRGIIHECDKLLRLKNNDLPTTSSLEPTTSPSDPTTPFPPQFYLIYSNALEQLGLLSSPDDLPKYLEAAIERLQW
ncbi:hypothetical protein HK097_005247, partial [Rhizophlyctis rosea]